MPLLLTVVYSLLLTVVYSILSFMSFLQLSSSSLIFSVVFISSTLFLSFNSCSAFSLSSMLLSFNSCLAFWLYSTMLQSINSCFAFCPSSTVLLSFNSCFSSLMWLLSLLLPSLPFILFLCSCCILYHLFVPAFCLFLFQFWCHILPAHLLSLLLI